MPSLTDVPHPDAGRTAIITGAARGLGLAMSKGFLEAGYRVFLVDRDEDALRQEYESLAHQFGARAHAHAIDLTDSKAPDVIVDLAVKEFGTLDVLINNAAVVVLSPFLSTSPEELKDTISVNIESVFQLTQRVATHMVSKKTGCIITLGSSNASVGVTYTSAYSTSKGAVTSFARQLAVELAPHGIVSNVIAPGTIMTDRVLAALDRDALDRRLSRIPTGRFVEAQDVVSLALFLASDSGRSINGQVLAIDGGFTIMGA